MTINVCHTLKINAPNVRWNTYEHIHRTGFGFLKVILLELRISMVNMQRKNLKLKVMKDGLSLSVK